MEKKLSIIIPIFNMEIYLEICLNSILNQLKIDCEVILINDGSTDDSEIICEKFCDLDDRFKYYKQENLGVSVARNSGMYKASGKWLVFVDPDDYLLEDSFNEFQKCFDEKSDVIIFSHNVVYNHSKNKLDNRNISGLSGMKYFGINDRKQLVRKALTGEKIFEDSLCALKTPWAKMYNRKFVMDSQILFPNDIKMGQDLVFNLEVYSLFNEIKCFEIPVYNYFINAGSTVNRFKPNINIINVELINSTNSVLRKYGLLESVEYEYSKFVVNSILWLVQFDLFHSENTSSLKLKKKKIEETLSTKVYSDILETQSENKVLKEFPIIKRFVLKQIINRKIILVAIIMNVFKIRKFISNRLMRK